MAIVLSGSLADGLKLKLNPPAAAYNFLYPCRASFNDFLLSLNNLQLSIVQLLKIISLYFGVYQKAYSFITTSILNLIYFIFETLTKFIPIPTFQNIPIPKPVYPIILTILIFAYLFISDSNIANSFRQSSFASFLRAVLRIICLPPIFFVSVDITPIITTLFSVLRAAFQVIFAFLWLIHNLLYAFLFALFSNPIYGTFAMSILFALLVLVPVAFIVRIIYYSKRQNSNRTTSRSRVVHDDDADDDDENDENDENENDEGSIVHEGNHEPNSSVSLRQRRVNRLPS